MKSLILNYDDIKKINKRLGQELTSRYKDDLTPPVFIGVMKGGLPFMMDLIKEVKCEMLLDFIQVSSFSGTSSTGNLRLIRDLSCDISSKRIVIIDDVIDSGITLKWLVNYLKEKYHPQDITTVVLLDKKCKRKVDIDADLVGKEIDDVFVVGYGLDYYDMLRNTTEIYVPTKEELELLDKKVK